MRVSRITTVALCAAATFGAMALSAPAFAQDFTATELRGGLTLISGPDGNVVAGADAAGLTLIGGASPEHARDLINFALQETGATALAQAVNTTWRPEVTGVNALAAELGATVTAHANTHQWLKYGTENRADGIVYEAQPEAALPANVLYDQGGTLAFGEDEIRIFYLHQAYTDSDLYAYFPGADVLVTGPAVRSDSWQMMDWWTGGYIGATLEAYDDLLEVAGDDTLIVPASGPVMTKAELQAQADMYREITMTIGDLLKAAMSPAEAVAERPTGDHHPEWADADRFSELAFRSFYAHLRGNPILGAIP